MPGYLNFKEIAESIDIEAVAHHLDIALKRGKDIRASCPACKGDQRRLQLFPETNSFRCYAAGISGDCISLYSHLKGIGMYAAARALQELFLGRGIVSTTVPSRDTAPATSPQKPGASQSSPASKAAAPASKGPGPFDPAAFAAKLIYSEEVEALGITEEDATRLGIGFHHQRKLVYLLIRNPDASISGFVGIKDGNAVKLPPRWISSNVVKLRRA